MKELVLQLSDLESIKIISNDDIDFNEMNICCDEIKAYFINKYKLRVGQDVAGDFFESFIKKLKKVINNKLQLNESLTKNLGFMQNEYYHEPSRDKPGFVKILSKSGESKFWVGLNYQIWETFADANPYVSTWIYNDDNENIIFEVTKNYKWHFTILEGISEDPEFINYEEFMKDYKPLIHRVIPHNLAVQWLEQVMNVYRDFFSTEEDYIRACEELNL